MPRRTGFARRTRTDLWGPSGGTSAASLLEIALLCHGVFGAGSPEALDSLTPEERHRL